VQRKENIEKKAKFISEKELQRLYDLLEKVTNEKEKAALKHAIFYNRIKLSCLLTKETHHEQKNNHINRINNISVSSKGRLKMPYRSISSL